ncbi:HNH nuclease [Fusarium oxysporum f. sp. vasinfectum]|nr:HNH nuclease [Fusarium oxysporum f. sp. vasinfectum]
MSSAAVTSQFRTLGWNIHLLCGADADHFAGLFHPPNSDTLTFSDIAQELSLCFEIPSPSSSNDNPWQAIAFASGDGSTLPPFDELSIISGQDLARTVSTPDADPSAPLSRLRPLLLQLVRHTDCNLTPHHSLSDHLQRQCATHIPYPTLRRTCDVLEQLHRRLLSLARRHQLKIRPRIFPPWLPPPEPNIPREQAVQTINSFRASCLAANVACVVTGKGRSWYNNPSVGPGLHACHIVPQIHYHVYPVPASIADSRESPRRLKEAWKRTWSWENGILLLSHLHELFDARLFSIHPETKRIRVFMPYDVLLDYHGSIAQVNHGIDKKALRHHYDMCCMENMAAKMPLAEALPTELAVRSNASQISPFASGSQTPVLSSATSSANVLSQIGSGDPVKQKRPRTDDPDESVGPLTVDGSSESSSSSHDSRSPLTHRKDNTLQAVDEHQTKRRRISMDDNYDVDVYLDKNKPMHRVGDPYWEGYITPWNSRNFLSDVNWELAKYSHCS